MVDSGKDSYWLTKHSHPLVHDALETVSHDIGRQAGWDRYYIPDRFSGSLNRFEVQLATLSTEERETLCSGEVSDADDLVAKHGMEELKSFLDDFFEEDWRTTRTGMPKIAGPWRCFHCNEVCETPEEAAEHFGLDQFDTPACVQVVSEGENAIIESRREWRSRAMTAEARVETVEYENHVLKHGLWSRFKGAKTAHEAWCHFESIEGRAIAAEAALNAAPRWLRSLLRRRAERSAR